MEKQSQPPAGWYPDPAGQGQRYWDGAQWRQPALPAKRPGRVRWWVWLVVVASALPVIALVCVPLGSAILGSVQNASRDDISQAANTVVVPEDFTLVDEHWTGNEACLLDSCELYRRYSSPSSKQETFHILATALQKAGFQCLSFCEGFDEFGHSLFTNWQRSDKRTINLTVFSTADPAAAGLSLRPPLDPARQVHADIKAT